MKKVVEAKVIINEEVSSNIYKMVIESPEVAATSKAGQFVNVYPKTNSTILPRPISINDITDTTITIVYAVVGKGTDEFSKYQAGDTVRVSTALGNGYTIKEATTSVLVGGGIGVPPLVQLAKTLKAQGAEKVIAVIGFRDEPILVDELKELGVEVHVATDSGKHGFKGNVIELMKQENIIGDYYYSCGPKIMLKNLASYCEELGKEVQVSMEERMGCGYGVCVGCVIKINDDTKEDGFVYKKVCKDGPVFLGSEVKWNE